MKLTGVAARVWAGSRWGLPGGVAAQHTHFAHLDQYGRLPSDAGVERQVAGTALAALGLKLGTPLLQAASVQAAQRTVQAGLHHRAAFDIQQAQIAGEGWIQLVRREQVQYPHLLPAALQLSQDRSNSLRAVEVRDQDS